MLLFCVIYFIRWYNFTVALLKTNTFFANVVFQIKFTRNLKLFFMIVIRQFMINDFNLRHEFNRINESLILSHVLCSSSFFINFERKAYRCNEEIIPESVFLHTL